MDAVATADPSLDRPGHCPPDVARLSLFTECQFEIDRHKWFESEKAGRDVGEAAIREWVQKHWWVYLRSRWIEHLQGIRFWMELRQDDFGLLQRIIPDDRDLLDTVLTKLKAGEENLDVIRWAVETQIPIEPVLHILQAFDVNSHRLEHQFDAA